MNNSFSLTFGRVPENFINHAEQYNSIKNCLTANHLCTVTGPRGCGKTVAITYVSDSFSNKDNWIVIDLNTERDMLKTAAAYLYASQNLRPIIGDGHIAKENGSCDFTVVLDGLLHKLTMNGINILFTVDEVADTKNTKDFLVQIQLYLFRKYSVYVLMAGLYQNIYELQNENTLTFLSKTPIFKMQPLNISIIKQKYQKLFKLDELKALEMAKFSNGYPFAYQVLGMLCFQKDTTYDNVIDEFDTILGEYVYQKVWSDLSTIERKWLSNLISNDIGITAISQDMYKKQFMTHNINGESLINKGLLDQDVKGKLQLRLPRFKEFVQRYCL